MKFKHVTLMHLH